MYLLPWKAAVSLSPVPLGWSLPTGAVQGELLAHCLLCWGCRELHLLLYSRLLGLVFPTAGQGYSHMHMGSPRQQSCCPFLPLLSGGDGTVNG